MVGNTYYLELMSIWLNIFSRRTSWTKPWNQITYFWKEKTRGIGCKFIRINTSDAERGCDTDYEVSKIQTLVNLKTQLKKLEKELNKKIKEKENKIKELEDEIKNLKLLVNK